MFNTHNFKAGSQSIDITAVSGTLTKNHPKSFFKRFQLGSKYCNTVLSSDPYYVKDYKTVKVIVLQVMLAGGNNEVIAEIVKKEDYHIEVEAYEN